MAVKIRRDTLSESVSKEEIVSQKAKRGEQLDKTLNECLPKNEL